MLRLTRSGSNVRSHSHSQNLPTRGHNTPSARRLRMEPLEDRRMLSVTLFVDADAPTGGDGLGWGSAYQDLQAALEEAGVRNADTVGENDVDQIWIAEGVYKPSDRLQSSDARSASFSLLDGVTLYGGFAGTETTLEGRDWSAYVTTLSGDLATLDDSSDNAYAVVYCGEAIEAAVDGVSIVGGMADGSYISGHPERTHGGGIYSDDGTLTVVNSTVLGNSASGSGGGIYSSGTLMVINSTLSENLATGDHVRGGGIYSSGTLTVSNSTFSKNWAEDDGGGIYSYGGTLMVTNSTLSENWSEDGGGGIYSYCGTLTVTNSTLSGNWAEEGGGGIYSYRGTLTVTNSTISGNSGDEYGGGIWSCGSSSTATLQNTLVAGNFASSGPDISGVFSGFHNLIGDGTDQSSLVDGEDGNQIGTAASPIDPRLSDWSELNNGQWGYYLLPGSPALDAGENALAVDAAGQPLVEDISGNPRIQNGTVDIGALEGAAVAGPGQVYVVTSLDMAIAEDGVLTFLEAFEAANRNQPVGDAPAGSFGETDVIRFAEGLSGTVPVEDEELTIHGDLSIEGPGAALLAFDAGGTSRVFRIEPSISVSLSCVTITKGLADVGGGIYNSGTLTIMGSTLSGNSATGNYARGGGIYNNFGTVTITDSTFSENLVTGDNARGGGIYNNSGTMTITGSTLSENSAPGDDTRGGGIHSSGTLTVTNSRLSGNSSWEGGGIYSSGTLTVTNSMLSVNSARYRGGGVYNDSDTLAITSSTLSGNSAPYGGGICIYGSSSTATLNNTIVAGNAASSGPDIDHNSGSFAGFHNLIGDGSGQTSLVHGEDGNQVGSADSPIDPGLSDWTELDNGRWTYYLSPGSPALNAGDNALAVDAAGQPLTEDIFGNERILGGTVDIGAVEGATAGGPGEVYVVTSLDETIAEDGVLTFLEAFEAANRNRTVGDAPAGSFADVDVIQFAEELSGTVPVEDGALTIHGDLSIEGPGAALLAFNGGGTSRVFLIELGACVSLSGMTITGGSADDGGGIYNSGTLTVTNSTLSENSAHRDGSGYGSGGRGGGIYSRYGTLSVTNSTFSRNLATGDYGCAGGIYSSGTLTVTNSTISENASSRDGGGIHSSGTLTVTNSTLSGNSASWDGGGIYSSGTLRVTNSTLAGNSATWEGGGIYFAGSTSSAATLNNTIVAGNAASSGPDIYHDSGTLSGSYNLIGDGSRQSYLVHGEDGNLVGTAENPIVPLLSDWVPLGGGRWGYYLLPDSPAIDAGENGLAVDAEGQPLTEDLYGNPRIQDGTVDIGAVEGATAGGPAQVYVVTSLDMTIVEDGVLTFLEAFEAANRNQPVGDAPTGSFAETDVIQFAEGLSGTVPVKDGGLVIHGDLSIEGPGAALLAFDGGGTSRVFLIELGASVSLSGMTITGGSADDGGGICNSGTLTVSNSTVSGNVVNGDDAGGGGIYSSGILTVANSTLSGNSATGEDASGGGIYSAGTLTVTDSALSQNSADDDGGGIYNSGTLTVTGSALWGNSAGSGGGIHSSGTLTLTDSTLSENSAVSGGGVFVHFSTVTVANSTLSDNSVTGQRASGGGIYNNTGTLTVANSTLSGNSATGANASGGGIHGNSGTLTVTGSTLSENWADADGGGIYIERGTLTFSDSALLGNWADGSGGGIYTPTGTLTVTNATLSRNSANDSGGAIYSLTHTLTVANSTLSENSAGFGGAIFIRYCTTTVSNSTLSGNSADTGGGICWYGDSHHILKVTNSTLSGNSARDNGGGICSSGSSEAMLNNTIVAGNAASSGRDVYLDESTLSGSHNLIGDGSGQSSLVHGEDGNQVGSADSPIDPGLSDWTELDNGQWGYYLLADSPALDAGEDALAVGVGAQPLVEDLYGHPRIQNGTVDIGSVEGAAEAGPAQVYMVTSLEETIADDGILTFLEAFEAANRNQPVGDAPSGSFGESDVIQFADGLNGTISVQDGELTIYGDLNIEGPGAEQLAFDAGGTSRVFLIKPSVSVSLSGMTITGGSANAGGGIYSTGTLTLTDSTLSGNAATGDYGYGGGIYSAGTLTVTDSTFSGNSASSGGGIYSSAATLTVANSAISGNAADDSGGGAYNCSGTLIVTNSTLSGNSAGDNGGGICDSSGTLMVANSTLSENSARDDGGGIYGSGAMTVTGSTLSGNSARNDGGGIYGSSGTLTVTTSTLAQNSAKYGGGGIYGSSGTLTVTNSTLTRNSATYGGGICSSTSTVTLTDSTLSENSADGSGGGICSFGTVTVTNSTLSENSARDDGGGIYSTGTVTVTGSTLSGNSVDWKGGGICSSTGTVTVTNSTLSGNSADKGSGIYSSGSSATVTLNNSIIAWNSASADPDLDCDSETLSGSYNLIGDGSGQSSLIDGVDGNLVGTADSPIDPRFVRNPSDGGDGWGDDPDTPDIDESANDDYGDLRLLPISPAVNTGDASLLPADSFDLDADGDTDEPIPFDLDGNARVFAQQVDMGAYECLLIPGDLDNDGQVGGSDLDVIRANWGQTVTPGSLIDGDPSGDGVVSGADLDIVRANWGCNAPAAAAIPAESGAELSAGDAVYGPVQRNESTSATEQARDALFAGREALAETAWMEAVERLRGRAKERQLAAVDRAFLVWECE